MRFWLLSSVLSIGCAQAVSDGPWDGGQTDADGTGEDTGVSGDGSAPETSSGDTGATGDAGTKDTGGSTTDTGGGTKDTGSGTIDTGTTSADSSTTAGPITGGPCTSGGTGATAFRVRWAGSGSTAYVVYEVTGLPDKTGFKVGSYPTSTVSYTAPFDDASHGGGLRLDGSNFVDVDLSTIGLTSITRATLSIYGRSFNTTASGSFSWLTFDGSGATPSSSVANSWPYQWYGPGSYLGSGPIGDATAAIKPGKTIKLRIKAAGSSALIVNQIELCLEAT